MELKKNIKIQIGTEDFFYDLFYGGYVKPEKILKNKEDVQKVKDAMKTIEEFRKAVDEVAEYL